jgi:hypothetical protein
MNGKGKVEESLLYVQKCQVNTNNSLFNSRDIKFIKLCDGPLSRLQSYTRFLEGSAISYINSKCSNSRLVKG